MAKDLSVKPDTAKNTRWDPGEPEEDRGDWVENTVDIYASVDSPPARAEKEHPKAAATAVIICLALLCLLLLAVITSLVIRHFTEVERSKRLQASLDNLTKERDQLQTSYDTVVQQRDDLRKKLNGLVEASLCHLSVGSSWYYISPEKRNWNESRQDCLQRQSDLLIINSKEEQELLIHLNKRVWFGLTDMEEEGTWKWVDGKPLNTTYWNSEQPDSNGIPPNLEEDCVEYHAGVWKGWNDRSCLENNSWICERNIC